MEIDLCIRARAWLRDCVHFDLLAYDLWLGTGVLVAPNPLFRRCGARIALRSSGGETLMVGGPPRMGADLSTVAITVEERRGGEVAWRVDQEPDALGRLWATAPSEVDAVRHEVVCRLRGVLDQEEPAKFFRGLWTERLNEGRLRHVAPPRRTPAADPVEVQVRGKAKGPPAPPLTALRKLELLQQAQQQRAGEFRPAETQAAPSTVYLLENDRVAAVTLIRKLVAQARQQVLLVDPYLEADDLQEFAMAAEHEGVAIRGLLNPRTGRRRASDKDGDKLGDLLVQQIETMRDPAQGFGEIDIRVSVSRRLHDRFLQIDDVIWHCGHSFNQVGKAEISLMTRVEQPAEVREVLAVAFAEAELFETHWRNRPIPQWSLRQEIAEALRKLATWVERPRRRRKERQRG
ncbi:hypothetical protein JMJ56_19580 [Belnapia sp. T18]|uniref:Phospholipase D-like domain-containing protein n=1 Tax=Belnapia arida TaxID=2804533 RepID=A0ABS1U6E6_9PROT|nr:VPA1262 family N-terminal domain-containing protein [Belnapia arida]MBL6080223.1 hypothetical protein [Belnapia arida]